MTQEMNNIFRLINVGNCNVLIDSIRPVNVIPKTCEPGAGKLFVPIFTTLLIATKIKIPTILVKITPKILYCFISLSRT